jgi:hypothetical protein
MSKHEFGQQVYPWVALVDTALVRKITGMLLELPEEGLRNLVIDKEVLQDQLHEATQVLQLAVVDGRDDLRAAAGAAAEMCRWRGSPSRMSGPGTPSPGGSSGPRERGGVQALRSQDKVNTAQYQVQSDDYRMICTPRVKALLYLLPIETIGPIPTAPTAG